MFSTPIWLALAFASARPAACPISFNKIRQWARRANAAGDSGAIGKMAPEQARKAAEKLGSVAHGEDPAAKKARERSDLPIGDLISAFIKDHMEAKRKASTAAAYRDSLGTDHKADDRHMKPDKVTRQDIAGLHSSLRKAPATANRALAEASIALL